MNLNLCSHPLESSLLLTSRPHFGLPTWEICAVMHWKKFFGALGTGHGVTKSERCSMAQTNIYRNIRHIMLSRAFTTIDLEFEWKQMLQMNLRPSVHNRSSFSSATEPGKRKIEIEFNFARENIPKPLLSSTCKSSSVLSKPFTQKKKAYLEPILCMLRLFNLKANSWASISWKTIWDT